MFYIILWIYILLTIVIWWFFIVAKIHAYKFKNFSPHITKVSFSLTISLIILTILGFLVIFSLKEKLENNNFNYDSWETIIEKIKKQATQKADPNVVDYDNW